MVAAVIADVRSSILLPSVMNSWIVSLLFVVWVAVAAASDFLHRRVINAWIVVGLVEALACSWGGMTLFGVSPAQAIGGALLGLVVLLPFFALRMMGGADIKVFAVLGAWCGPRALPALWIVASIMAGLHAVAVLVTTRSPLWMRGCRGRAADEGGTDRATPYVTCLGAAALAIFAMRLLERTGP